MKRARAKEQRAARPPPIVQDHMATAERPDLAVTGRIMPTRASLEVNPTTQAQEAIGAEVHHITGSVALLVERAKGKVRVRAHQAQGVRVRDHQGQEVKVRGHQEARANVARAAHLAPVEAHSAVVKAKAVRAAHQVPVEAGPEVAGPTDPGPGNIKPPSLVVPIT